MPVLQILVKQLEKNRILSSEYIKKWKQKETRQEVKSATKYN